MVRQNTFKGVSMSGSERIKIQQLLFVPGGENIKANRIFALMSDGSINSAKCDHVKEDDTIDLIWELENSPIEMYLTPSELKKYHRGQL